MINPTYPGVYVLEESSGARAVAGVATSITSFIGMTKRGPLLTPKRIFNLPEYERIFGSSTTAGEMTEQVKLYFDNGGGEAWITRIAKDSDPAAIMIETEAGLDTLQITALEDGVDGNNLRAEVDYNTLSPEATFNLQIYRLVINDDGTTDQEDVEAYTNLSMNPDANTFVEKTINGASTLVSVEAQITAAGHTESLLYSGLVLPSDNTNAGATITHRIGAASGQLKIKVNRGPAITVTVTDPATTGTAFAAALETAIQARLTSEGYTETISVSVNGSDLIQMDISGASFEILSGDANDIVQPLMLSSTFGAIYVDQFAANRPAPTGYTSRIHGSGASNNINKLTNYMGQLKASLTDWTLADASLEASHSFAGLVYPEPTGTMITGTEFVPDVVAGDLSAGSLSNVAENLDVLAQSIANESSGRWEASLHGYRIVLKPTFSNSEGDLTASLTSTGGAPPYNIGAASRLFATIAVPNNVTAYTLGTPAGGGAYQNGAQQGTDGLLPEEDEYRAAFDIIEREVDLFNLMVLPRAKAEDGTQSDTSRKTAFNAASSFCAKERAFLLVDPPSTDNALKWTDATSAASGSDDLRIGLETRNSAVFWPRLKKADNSFQDPAGPMAGLMARTDGARGVWKAAAGVEATVRGVSGVEYSMSDPDNGVINPKAVNALRVFPDGVLSWGARTLIGFNDSGNIDDKYIPVRRTMLFIEESLYRGLRFAVFEPNDEPLWAQIRLAAGSFMNTLFRQGAFAGGKTSDAYYVLCDKTTTTETDKNLGIVNVVVAFAPLKPAEFVILTVKQIAGQTQT